MFWRRCVSRSRNDESEREGAIDVDPVIVIIMRCTTVTMRNFSSSRGEPKKQESIEEKRGETGRNREEEERTQESS